LETPKILNDFEIFIEQLVSKALLRNVFKTHLRLVTDFLSSRHPQATSMAVFRNTTDRDGIGAFPNENSRLTLFFLVMQREYAKHDRL